MAIWSEFPGQFSMDELLDMPKKAIQLLAIMAGQVNIAKRIEKVKGENSGDYNNPYIIEDSHG